MDGDTFGRAIYLVLLGTAIAGWLFTQGRTNWGRHAQNAAVWGLIFLGAIAVIGLWSDIRRTSLALPQISDEQIAIPRAPDGHYYLTFSVNSAPIRFVVDTGATNVVLSRADAYSAGINLDTLRFLGEAQTANGTVPTARITLDELSLGPVVERNVRAYVNGGEQDGSLLGMDYLRRFSQITIRGDQMILSR